MLPENIQYMFLPSLKTTMNKAESSSSGAEDDVQEEERKLLDTMLPVIDSRADTSKFLRHEVSIGSLSEGGSKEKYTGSKDSTAYKTDSASQEGKDSHLHHHEEERIVPGASDILLGRGKPYQNHEGNMAMRKLIDEYKEQYQAASRIQKPLITEELLARLRETGARFLKKVDEDSDQWIQVSRDIAFEKISHAFRSRIGGSNSSRRHKKTASEISLDASPHQDHSHRKQPPQQQQQQASNAAQAATPYQYSGQLKTTGLPSQQQQQQQHQQLQQLISSLSSSISSSAGSSNTLFPSAAASLTTARAAAGSSPLIDWGDSSSSDESSLTASTLLTQYLAATGANNAQTQSIPSSRISAALGGSINNQSSLTGGNLTEPAGVQNSRFLSSSSGNGAAQDQGLFGESARRRSSGSVYSFLSPTAQRAYDEMILLAGVLQQQEQHQHQHHQHHLQQQLQQRQATAAAALPSLQQHQLSSQQGTDARAQVLNLQQQLLNELLSNVNLQPTNHHSNQPNSTPPPSPPPPPPPPHN